MRLVVAEGEHWGMGRLWNEVRRGLFLTKEERGFAPAETVSAAEDEAG